MKVHLSLVKPTAARDWRAWLDWPTEIPERSADGFLLEKHYSDARARYLVLVHGADESGRTHDLNMFLSPRFRECRDRVWILYYSGSGYAGEASSDLSDHVHCLGYPIAHHLGAAQQRCFLNAIEILKDATEPSSERIWQALYPPDNVSAVRLLLLLTAAKTVDVDYAIDELLTEAGESDTDLLRAYSEYCSASTLFGSSSQPFAYHAVREHLQLRTYDVLREEFSRVLGGVPD